MNTDPAPVATSANQNKLLWAIIVLLGAIAIGLWTRPGGGDWLPAALAQQPGLAGARGVFAFTGQIDHNRFGLFMLDVDQGTLWCYELDPTNGAKQLRLVAARSWIYDRYLQDFNCAAPNFRTVQELVAQQRAQIGQEPPVPADTGKTKDGKPPEREPSKTGEGKKD